MSNMISGLSFLCISGATNSIINSKHIKPYQQRRCSKKVKYITSAVLYCMTHDVKVSFFMPEFSIRNIVLHHFYVDSDEYELFIGHDMVIGRDLVV